MFAMVWLAVVMGAFAAVWLRSVRPLSGRADIPDPVSKARTRRLPPRPIPTAPYPHCESDRVPAKPHAASRGVTPVRPHHRRRVDKRAAICRDGRLRPAAPVAALMLVVPMMAAPGRAAFARPATG